VGERLDRELRHRLAAIGDHRPRGLGQLEMTRQEVGMKVSLDHPLDGQTVRPRIIEVPVMSRWGSSTTARPVEASPIR
jgi:hypothetical protein